MRKAPFTLRKRVDAMTDTIDFLVGLVVKQTDAIRTLCEEVHEIKKRVSDIEWQN